MARSIDKRLEDVEQSLLDTVLAMESMGAVMVKNSELISMLFTRISELQAEVIELERTTIKAN